MWLFLMLTMDVAPTCMILLAVAHAWVLLDAWMLLVCGCFSCSRWMLLLLARGSCMCLCVSMRADNESRACSRSHAHIETHPHMNASHSCTHGVMAWWRAHSMQSTCAKQTARPPDLQLHVQFRNFSVPMPLVGSHKAVGVESAVAFLTWATCACMFLHACKCDTCEHVTIMLDA